MTKDYIDARLKDPQGAKYIIHNPFLGYIGNALSGYQTGWLVCGTVNAKDSAGAYTGARPFQLLIRGNQIIAFSEAPC